MYFRIINPWFPKIASSYNGKLAIMPSFVTKFANSFSGLMTHWPSIPFKKWIFFKIKKMSWNLNSKIPTRIFKKGYKFLSSPTRPYPETRSWYNKKRKITLTKCILWAILINFTKRISMFLKWETSRLPTSINFFIIPSLWSTRSLNPF